MKYVQEAGVRAESSASLRISQRGDVRDAELKRHEAEDLQDIETSEPTKHKEREAEGERGGGGGSRVTQNKDYLSSTPHLRQPSWVANYDEILGAPVGLAASPESI